MSKSPPSKKKVRKPVPVEQGEAELDDHQQTRTRDRKRTLNELKLALHNMQRDGEEDKHQVGCGRSGGNASAVAQPLSRLYTGSPTCYGQGDA